jgi:Tannase and feruloyl esterase
MFLSVTRRAVRCAAAGALFAASAPMLAHAAATCESLKTVSLADTTVDSTETVAAGEYKVPNSPWLPPQQLPEHCRLRGTIRPTSDSEIKFEVWLPAASWNGKLQGAGNGGFAGSINYMGLALGVQRGYVAASTDTGHSGKDEDTAWAKGHPEKIVDFGHRAIHLMTVNAKAIAKAYYGEAPRRAYFASCSNGGRQALMTAQRYPEDYDGIIAGAPANDWTGLIFGFTWNAQALMKPDAFIPASKAVAIQAAVNHQCDALDGVSDGVVSAPQKCDFKPQQLLCGEGQSKDCLSEPQVAALQAIYQGARTSKGSQLFSGFTPGAEVGTVPGISWDGWVFGAEAGRSSQGRFATNFMRSMVTGDDNWQLTAFDFDRDAGPIVEKLGPILDATDPDLSRFAKRGGKLILFHGWNDAAIPPLNTIKYYDSVGARMGAAQREQFARLFMIPGMQHCLAGPGPSSFGGLGPALSPPNPAVDLSSALEQWVEKGIAPESVRAVKGHDMIRALYDPTQGGVERSGLICAWPKQARWNGSGDAADAASYTCVDPKGK